MNSSGGFGGGSGDDFGAGGFGGGGVFGGGGFGGGGFGSGAPPFQQTPPLRRTRSGFFEETNQDEDENFWNHDSDVIDSPEKRMMQAEQLREMQRQQLRHYAAQVMMQRAQWLGGPPVFAMPGALGSAFSANMYPGPWYGGGGRGM